MSGNIYGGPPAKDRATGNGAASALTSTDFIVVLVESKTLFDSTTLSRVAVLQKEIAALPTVDTVIAATSMSDLLVEGGELRFVPLYTPGAEASDRLERAITTTPLLKKFLVSKSGNALTLYVVSKPGAPARSVVPAIQRIVVSHAAAWSDTPLLVFGSPILNFRGTQIALQEFILLGCLVLVLVYFLEVLFTRSFVCGAALWLASLLPALWTIALFPLFGVRVEIATIIVPIMVIALSTRYGIYLYRYFMATPARSMVETLDGVGAIIASAGFTTMLGFATLAITPIQLLRTLGLLVIPGIVFAVAASLFLVPPLLSRFADRAGYRLRPTKPRATPPFRPAVLILYGAALLALAAGTLRVQYDYRSGSFFKAGTELSKLVKAYEHLNGGFQEMEVVIDSGREYGLVEPELYSAVDASAAEISELPGRPVVLTFTDFRRLDRWSPVGHRRGAPVSENEREHRRVARASFRTERRGKHRLPDRSILPLGTARDPIWRIRRERCSGRTRLHPA